MRWGPTAFAALAFLPGVAQAQAYRCAVPASVPRPRPDLPDATQPRRVLPTGGYTLAISWAPQYCYARRDDTSAAFECGGGNRFGFTLHGLWPDGTGRTWPQYCRRTGIIPPAVVRANLCATPSAQLLQHEWAKHGTCMSARPADYFAQSRRLFDALRYPDMAALAQGRTTAGRIAAAMARANPGIGADMMRITATKSGWLDEIWLCLDLRKRYARCPAHQGGLAPDAVVRVSSFG